MKNYIRGLSLVLALVLCLSVVLIGCSSEGSSSSSSEASSGTSSETTTTEAAQSGTITFYGFSDWVTAEDYAPSYEEAAQKFADENPGFTVDLQSDPWSDWETKYKTMFASGNAPDVLFVNNPDFPAFANADNLLNLDDYVDSGYFDDFFEGVLGMYVWNGKHMAIPFTTDCRILWYNKDLFTEAGLDPEKPPTTWDELVEYASTITTKTGKYGFGMDLGLKEFPAQALYNASTGNIISVASDGAITPTVDATEFRKYLQTLVDLKPSFQPDYTSTDHHDVAKLFAEGQYGMIIGNTLSETEIYSTDFYGQALVPKMDSSAPNGSYGGGFGIAVSSKTKYPEQAIKFAQILCSPELNGKLISDIPASNEGLKQSAVYSDSNYKLYLEQIQYARQAQPKTLFYSEIESAIYDTVVEVIVSGQSIDDAVAALTDNITSITK